MQVGTNAPLGDFRKCTKVAHTAERGWADCQITADPLIAGGL
jgi:hypothetical protein